MSKWRKKSAGGFKVIIFVRNITKDYKTIRGGIKLDYGWKEIEWDLNGMYGNHLHEWNLTLK